MCYYMVTTEITRLCHLIDILDDLVAGRPCSSPSASNDGSGRGGKVVHGGDRGKLRGGRGRGGNRMIGDQGHAKRPGNAKGNRGGGSFRQGAFGTAQ